MKDEHSFEVEPINCSGCGSESLLEQRVYYCPCCIQPFCLNCKDNFTSCEECKKQVCDNCIKFDKGKGKYLCVLCSEDNGVLIDA